MAIFTKPNFNSVWAESGVKSAPSSAKVSQGWIVEIPPYEYENWIQNRQDQILAHINQFGIPSWDSETEYQANKSYVQGLTTGVVYRAVITHTNRNPETDPGGAWTLAFEPPGLALQKSQNLADVPNKALARTNLGITTTAEYDARYLLKSQNLADVPNKATARNNLDVYSKTESVGLFLSKSQNLADLPNKELARNNLGIQNETYYNTLYLQKSQNLADVPNKATARTNLGLGGAAVLGVGTVSGTVAAGNDSRIVNAVQNSLSIIAGDGLTGGGNLSANRTVSLGIPSHITATSSNSVSPGSHSHAIDMSSIIGFIGGSEQGEFSLGPLKIKFGTTDFIGGNNTQHTTDFYNGAFPTECLFVLCGTKTRTLGLGPQRMAQYISKTASSFTWFSDQLQEASGQPIACQYIAIGR